MKKDSKDYESPTEFDKEYGVIQWNRSITPTGGRSNPVPPHACCPVAQRNRRWNLHLRLFKQAALAVPKTTEIIDLRGIHMEADARRSILTLTATNQTLISTLDEVMKIQTEGAQKRKEAEKELGRIEGELKQKLLELRG